MQQSVFEKMDLTVSRLGFGAMRLPTLPGGGVDEARTAEMVAYAIAHGVTYFDTAYTYMGGESERVMGRVLKAYPRDRFYLADKMPLHIAKSAEGVRAIFAEQLEKCQVDHFDFYLVHALDRNRAPLLAQYEAYDFLCRMRREGKIRHLGFSFHDSPQVLEDILSRYDFEFVQIQFNYLDWTVQDAQATYQVLQKHGLPAVVMEPVRGGFLANLPKDAAAILQEALPGRSFASTALRWVGGFDGVKVILSGMSNLEQVRENVETFEHFEPLTPAQVQAAAQAAACLTAKQAIPCTGCRYCDKCPQSVPIAEIFSLYNRRKVLGEAFRVMHSYTTHLPVRADACVGCGYCKTQCPQRLDIPALLKVCHAELVTRGE